MVVSGGLTETAGEGVALGDEAVTPGVGEAVAAWLGPGVKLPHPAEMAATTRAAAVPKPARRPRAVGEASGPKGF